MAVLTFTEIQNIALDRAQVNVATDAPFTSTEMARFINDAYADVFEASGGGVLNSTHAATWNAFGGGVDGAYTGILYSIGEIIACWSALANSTNGGQSTDDPLDRVDKAEIDVLRSAGSGLGTYATPKVYSVIRLDVTDPAALPTLRLDVWPYSASRFHPILYIPQFTAIASAGVTTPNVSDIESRDIALLTAMKIAPLAGRAELVPSIAADVSTRTKAALDRKFSAMLDARQDK